MIRAMEYYSDSKKNEILIRAAILMNLENMRLSEITQTQKDKYCRIPQRQKVDWRLPPGAGGRGNGELLSNGYRVSVWNDENILEMDRGDNCTTP